MDPAFRPRHRPPGRFLLVASVKSLAKLRFSPTFWVVLIAISFFLTQIILFDEGRFVEFDEADYISEASSRFTTNGWDAHRSGGILWLVRPLLLVSGSLVHLRWYLAALSAIAVGLGFSRWVRPCGMLAPVGMSVFLVFWLPLFYGSEVSPNLYVASAAVGAAGSMIAFSRDERRADLAVLAVFLGAATYLRLSDGLVLSVGIVFGAAVVLQWRIVARALSPIGAGLLVGALPWLGQAFIRFGGPLNRLEAAVEIVGGGFRWNLGQYLRLQDGPLIGPDRVQSISTAGLGVLLVCVVLAGFGVADAERRRGPRFALVVGIVMALPYLLYVEALAPRFLMPSIALVAITVGAGVLRLWRRRIGFGILAVLLLAGAAFWSGFTADRVESEQFAQREEIRRVAESVAVAAGAGRCEFLSQFGHPQITLRTGCTGAAADLQDLRCQIGAVQRRHPGVDVIIVLVSAPPEETGYLTPIDGSKVPQDWTLYVAPADESVPCDIG